MVLGGGTDTHMFYVQGGCQVAIMGRGCRIGLKKCIGVHCRFLDYSGRMMKVGLDAGCISQGGFLSLK